MGCLRSNLYHTTASSYHQPQPFISMPQQQAFHLSCYFSFYLLLTFPTIETLGALDYTSGFILTNLSVLGGSAWDHQVYVLWSNTVFLVVFLFQ